MLSGFYKCDHCYKFSKDPLLIKNHEEVCLYNPANKHCNSCAYRKKIELTAPASAKKTRKSKTNKEEPKRQALFALGSSINNTRHQNIKVSIPSSEETVNTGVYEYVCKKGYRVYLRENKTGCNSNDWQPATNIELKNRSNSPEF